MICTLCVHVEITKKLVSDDLYTKELLVHV